MADGLGLQLHMGGPDGLVGILGTGLGLVYMEFSVVIALSVAGPDKVRRGGHGLVGQAKGVGTHIGNEAQGAFPLHVHALIELLGHHHGFLGGHVQLPGGLLLQRGGGEGRRGGALLLCLLHIGHGEFPAGNVINHRLGFRLTTKLPLLVLSIIVGNEAAGLSRPV